MAGALFETAVLSELVKLDLHRGRVPSLWFWRTARGEEVDFLVEESAGLHALEVKRTATPRSAMASGLRRLRGDLGDRIRGAWLVHSGSESLPVGEGAWGVPFGGL